MIKFEQKLVFLSELKPREALEWVDAASKDGWRCVQLAVCGTGRCYSIWEREIQGEKKDG